MSNTPLYCEKIFPVFPWNEIDTVLLDMDGTLLDKHFDDYFWEQYLPEHYSLAHDLSVDEAKNELLARYHKVQHTLDWSDLDFWSDELGLDLQELKMRINHLIGVHPYVIEFFEFCLKKPQKTLSDNQRPFPVPGVKAAEDRHRPLVRPHCLFLGDWRGQGGTLLLGAA